jgi:dolichol kinase
MSRIRNALLATYNFFAGDAIILVAALLAFAVAGLLVSVFHAPNVLAALVLIVLLVAGLATTLGREAMGRPRTR